MTPEERLWLAAWLALPRAPRELTFFIPDKLRQAGEGMTREGELRLAVSLLVEAVGDEARAEGRAAGEKLVSEARQAIKPELWSKPYGFGPGLTLEEARKGFERFFNPPEKWGNIDDQTGQ